MKIIETDIHGIKIIEPKIFSDSRGFFFEAYSQQRYKEAGLPSVFVQDNVSVSTRGTLRGLHFQNPGGQGKLITVLSGEVYDVAVDLRKGSPTFGRWFGTYLNSENLRQIWIPKGFAHGFQVTSETALFSYKCDAYYNSETEWSLLWNDPELAIEWPIKSPQLSRKDQEAKKLHELDGSVYFELSK